MIALVYKETKAFRSYCSSHRFECKLHVLGVLAPGLTVCLLSFMLPVFQEESKHGQLLGTDSKAP